MTDAEVVRETEARGNRPNRWHLIFEDKGVGPVRTVCGRVIERFIAHFAKRYAIELEQETSLVRRCKRCWK